MAHADIVFGNETEADEFANSNGYGVSIGLKLPKKLQHYPWCHQFLLPGQDLWS